MNYEEKYKEALERAKKFEEKYGGDYAGYIFPELAESEDERIRRTLVEYFGPSAQLDFIRGVPIQKIRNWLEKQKENPKSADSIPSNCVSDAKCEDRWHKVGDSLPDNPREVLCKDEAGNYFIGRYYSGEGWEISNYDDEDKPHHLNPPVSKWIDFPSEKQKEQKHTLKFKVGDKVHLEGDDVNILTITGIEKDRYLTNCAYGPILFGTEDIWQIVKQKPAEWSEEDENALKYLHELISFGYTEKFFDAQTAADMRGWLNTRLKSLRPSWKPSEDELAKKHLDGYCMGREDTLREMKDFVESHFTHREYKSPECGTCASAWNTASGTSTATLHGNTSATDGREHSPSFTD